MNVVVVVNMNGILIPYKFSGNIDIFNRDNGVLVIQRKNKNLVRTIAVFSNWIYWMTQKEYHKQESEED